MHFENDVQKQTYARVRDMAERMFGMFAKYDDEHPLIFVKQGSALAFVRVAPWADSAVVVARSYVARGVTADADLYKHLLTMNDQVVFGAFALDSDGDVVFQQTVVGPTIDEDELKSTVLAVLATADDVDEDIVARWGGKRGMD